MLLFDAQLCGAEVAASGSAVRTCTVDLPQPWRVHTVERNMNVLKFYYDLATEIDAWEMAYGPCWEPCLAQINLCLNKIIPPSKVSVCVCT
jgi:hypothetical protein